MKENDMTIAAGIMVREATPPDLPALQAFVRNLSVKTRAARFFAPVAELPSMLVQAIQSADPAHHLLIAGHRETGHIISLAQFALLPQAPGTCDIAVVVADAWQGRGLGRWLLPRLLADARSAGLREATGEVLRYNRAMLALARATGFSLLRHPTDASLVRIVRALEEPAAMPALLAA
jgi:acetyltransferase